MANYYLNDDGTLTKENKKKKGKNYILQEDGSLILSPEDTAPVKTTTSKRTWFNSGLFEDGLDFEDIPKTLLGTNVDFAEDLSSGLAGIGEGIIDTVATGVGAIAKKLGKDDFADKTQKFIERDLVNEYKWDEKLASKIPGVETLQMANVVANKGDTEKVSVLGEKTDAVVQSAGQLGGTYGLQAVGVPWWLTTGATSFGGGAEEAFQNDATYGEAGTYGLINAGAEIISEKLTGGIKFGGVALDEGLKKTLTKGISNKVAKTLVNFGWDAAGEGFEEVFSEVMTNIGKKLTYEKESTLEELLLSEDAMDAYLESFIGGAVLGGGANVGKVARSAKTGRDYDTGLTVNEQSVVDAEVKKRITERQKTAAVKEKIDRLITEQEKTFGTLSDSEKKRIKEQVQLEEIDYTTTKISKKERTEIEKQVREDLEKGYIGIDQIESTLASGKTAEIKDLESQLTNTSDKVKKSEIQAKIKQLKADRATQLTGALGKDTYLQESYRQEALKRKEFSREVKEEDTDITKELLESAKNSKMNDTRRMHDLFEYTNKIANDTGTKYGFVNNEQLKQLGHDVDGRTINGLVRVNEDGTTKVLINVDSEKALNTIIGHETTHLLEGTSEYKALQDIAKEYAITKGEYDSRLKQIQSLYEGTNANIENEITADLVGDYLFTDEQFINSLSTKQPNVFQKIYDYIKHAYKMATAGSKEARQLEQLKRRFDKAYKEMSKATTGEVDSNLTTEADSNTEFAASDVKYSVSVTDKKTIDFLENQEHITTYKAMQVIDGKLYPPMHAEVKGDDGKYRLGNYSQLGVWQRATEDPTNIKIGKNGKGYFDLRKGNGKTVRAAYNPYEHSSNLVLNDQFEEAYNRPNLVVVEGEIPSSEMTSGYRAEYAKDSTGVLDWKAGTVAGKLKDNKRKVYLSRWFKPVRILSDAEVAAKYKELLGEDVSVPFNVVTPSLLSELENVGVSIDYEGSPMYKSIQKRKAAKEDSTKYSLSEADSKYAVAVKNGDKVPDDGAFFSTTDSQDRELTKEQQEYFKDSKVRDEDGNLRVVYHGSSEDFTVFDRTKARANMDIQGNFFSPWDLDAQGYGENVRAFYLNITNPAPEGIAYKALNKFKGQNGAGIKAREYLESLGYDGVNNGDEEYITFYPHQIKSTDNGNPTDNPDINLSLSKPGEDIPADGYAVYGSDVKLQEGIAPVNVENALAENAELRKKLEEYTELPQESKVLDKNNLEQIAAENDSLRKKLEFFTEIEEDSKNLNEIDKGREDLIRQALEEIAPIREDIRDLKNTLSDLRENVTALAPEPEGYKALAEEDLPYIEQEREESFRNITEDSAPVEQEYYNMPDTAPLDDKSLKLLSKNMRQELGLKNNQVAGLRKIIQDFSTSETASKEDLYNAIESEFGTIYEKKKLDTLQEIKASLRSMKINVSDTIKSDIPDYFQFKQRNFGKIRFANDGLAVDDVYEGLKDIYPEYFPDNIANPTDQLLKIADVVNMDANYIEEYALPEEQIQEVTDFIYESISDYKRQKRQEASENAAKAPIDESMIPYEVPELVDDIAPVREDLAESDGLKNKIKVVEDNLGKEKKRLDDEYAKTLNPLKEEIKSKEEFISNKALNLYNELKGLKKGVRASDELSYLLDYGFSWNELKTSLLRVKAFPTSEVYSNSAVESIIRETLGREYEEKLYQVSEIEAEYKDAVEKVQKDTFETIRKLKEGKNEAEPEDLVTKTKKELRKQLLVDESDFFAKALDNAKNRSMILMNNTDTIRNTELVFGRENGKKINDLIFQKEIDNEAKSIAWQNKERAEIKDLGIKARSKESAAVQKWGEGKYVNEYGDEVEYTDVDLMNEFPDINTRQKIKNAANVIRGKYDNYIETANSVLTRLGFDPIQKRNDYMRHFQELSDVFSKYGIPFNAQHMKEYVLPTDINGLTEFWSPNKNYFANMQPRKGRRTTLDAITGIDGYISGVANLIYHTEDIQRGRAFEELIRDTYGEDKGWDNLENLPKEEQAARAEKIQDNHLSNYAAWVHEWTNNIAGKKNKLDRSFETMIGRKVFSFLDGTRKQTGANMIGFNASSTLTNFIAPIQAMAKTNKLAVAKGTADTIKNIFIKDNFAEKNSFLTSRMGTDMLSKTAWQKIQDAGFVFMKGTDWFAANQIVRSKYYELRSKGMSEEQAHAESGKFAARIMGDRTKGANAQLYNSKLFNIIGQFQLEVNNQLYSMFYDTYQESKENAQSNALRTAAGMTFTLGQLFTFTHVFGKTFESIAGYNPTFDIIGIIATALGVGDDDDDKTTSERLKDAADELVDALPYVSALTGGGRIPITNAIPNLIGVATGGTDDYGNELTLGDEFKKLIYLAPPTGGNQIRKTFQGLKMFDKDNPVPGSYTDSGNLRFPVEDTAINRIQAGIFGQWSNKNARDYFDNERQPLREKQIQEYKDLDLPIADYWEYREGLKDQKTVEDKFNYIADLDLPIDKKNIMINNAVDRDESIDLTNYDDFSSYEEFDYAIKNPEKYCLSRAVAKEFSTYKTYVSDLNDLRADKDSNGKTISGSRKEKVINYINGLNADYGEKIILFKSEYPADDTYNYEIIDYLNNRQDISYAEMETILKELGFQVDSNGNVRW